MLNIVRQIGGQQQALESGCYWMLDNGQYTDKWTWKLWWYWLNALLPFKDKCLGILIPDKVADMILTLHYFRVYSHIPRELGYPVGLCTQDGMTPDMIPWSALDCLFIGGSNNHKRGREGQDLILEAKKQEKSVTIGRVEQLLGS